MRRESMKSIGITSRDLTYIRLLARKDQVNFGKHKQSRPVANNRYLTDFHANVNCASIYTTIN